MVAKQQQKQKSKPKQPRETFVVDQGLGWGGPGRAMRFDGSGDADGTKLKRCPRAPWQEAPGPVSVVA